MIDTILQLITQEASIYDPGERVIFTQEVRAAILVLALAEISPTLTAGEEGISQRFLAGELDDAEAVSALFASEERQKILISAVMKVVEDLCNDPDIIREERQEQLLSNLENYADQLVALA